MHKARPAMTSVTVCGLPGKGTWVNLMPARWANSSLARCGRLPTTVAWSTWAGLRLGQSNKVGDTVYVAVGIDDQHIAPLGEQRDRRQIPRHIEVRIGIDDLVDDDRQGCWDTACSHPLRRGRHSRRRCSTRRPACSLTAICWPSSCPMPSPSRARGDVCRRPRRKADNEMNWTCRVGFRPSQSARRPAARLRQPPVAGIVYGEASL